MAASSATPGPFRWELEKNLKLQVERHVSFELVVAAIESNQLLAIVPHPKQEKYPGQQIFVVHLTNFQGETYVYCVPFVQAEDHVFLKTIYPSRKYKQIYEANL